MTDRKLFIFLSLLILLISGSIWSVEKKNVKITKVDNVTISDLRIRPTLSTADTCIVRHDQGLVWIIGNWVVGNELYKSYLDPELTCDNPYPYSVTEINMPLYFAAATSITVSVDVEQVDYSNQNCPSPDTIMLGISPAYTFDIPGEGIYNIWVPFDQPIVVTEPFFAGFFIGDIDTNVVPSVLTDSNLTSSCVSYNAWDSTGFVDLMDWGFPGQLALYASGIPGGTPSDPIPVVTILSPNNNETKYKTTEIWVEETSGSTIIDYVSFAYAVDTGYIEIGRDYDGTKAFRDGVNPSNNASGFSITWDFSAVPEGTYDILVTAVDTLGISGSDQISLILEPTPPIAEITSPSFGAAFCPQFDILMSSNDEDLFSVSLAYKRSDPNFSIGAQTLLMSDFGNYYSSAIAASLAIQALEDRGIYYLMRDAGNAITTTQMANLLAGYFSINTNNGVYDENIFNGLRQFSSTISNVLHVDYIRDPNYIDLRNQMELKGNVLLAGLGGTSNNWVLIDGFSGTAALDGTYPVRISNPLTGLIETVQLRNIIFGSEIFYNGGWQPIDIIFLVGTDGWSNPLTDFGVDLNRTDGWSFDWTPPNLWQSSDYFIQSKGTDFSSLKGFHTTMYSYDCTQFYLAGDFNNDGVADISDLNYIVAYFINRGPPPVGGDARADTNCDGYLNITDIVYYANFIFGMAPTPCY